MDMGVIPVAPPASSSTWTTGGQYSTGVYIPEKQEDMKELELR